MGDMADFVNDMAQDDECLYDSDSVKCRNCGKDNLMWSNEGNETNPVWRLVNEKGLHYCPVRPLKGE